MTLYTEKQGGTIDEPQRCVQHRAALTTPRYKEQGMAESQPIQAHAAPQPKERMSIPLSRNLFAIIDCEDFEKVFTTEFRDGRVWTGRVCDLSFYPTTIRSGIIYATANTDSRSHRLRMHRLIAEATAGVVVDHISHNGLENWRGNLRIATRSQNCRNSRKQVRSASRFKGVAFCSKATWTFGRFQARICVNKKHIHLGTFLTEEDAARAYDAAARTHFGAFAFLNFPDAMEAK